MGAELCVVRNDEMTLSDVRALNPSHIVISPGPGDPDDGGISLDVIAQMGSATPILGVCLGHQCIGQHYGGVVKRAARQMHGKTSLIYHDDDPMFAGLPNPFQATRYHSLIVEPETLPACLRVTARTENGEIMGLRHSEFPVMGVQFHPESILTPDGRQILRNFLALSMSEKVR
jgi:anthranilate synthase/aminodeoxychorismate synthase-like glutamine amidotransferase